jgi:P-type Cu+ transporter
MKKVILKISGMHCTSCAMNIDGELEDAGVKEAKTNYAKQQAEVSFDEEKISEKSIFEIIKKLGYEPEVKG